MKTVVTVTEHKPHWLVLGASGFIGTALVAALRAAGRSVTGSTRTRQALANSAPDSLCLDLWKMGSLVEPLRQLKPDVIVNATGHDGSRPAAEWGPFYAQTTRHLLTAVTQAGRLRTRVVLLGSAAECGLTPAQGATETTPDQPLTLYGQAKCAQYHIAQTFRAQGIQVVTARIFNLLGCRQPVHLFPQSLIQRLRTEAAPVTVQQGHHLRDWLDVRDAAQALIHIGETAATPDRWQVASGIGRPVAELAIALGRLADKSIYLEPAADPQSGLWRSLGQNQPLCQIGWRPRYDLATSLKDMWTGQS